MTQATPPEDLTMQRSSRDASDLPARLAAWLAGLLPPGAAPLVVLLGGIDANGLSSETLPLDVTWTDGRRRTHGRLRRPRRAAGRGPAGLPELRAARTSTTPSGSSAGSPTSRCPRCGGWSRPATCWARRSSSWTASTASCRRTCCPTTSATTGCSTRTPEQQRALQDATVGVLAKLHAIPDAARRSRSSTAAHRGQRARPRTSPGRAAGTTSPRPASAARRWWSGPWPGSRRTCPRTTATRPVLAGATRGSGTCSTATSSRSASSTGRWRRSARASST